MLLSLDTLWLDNSLQAWSLALGLALSLNLLVMVAKWFAVHHLKRFTANRTTRVDDVVVAMARRTNQLLVLGVSLLAGTRYLDLTPAIDLVLVRVATLSAFLQLGLWLNGALALWIERARIRTRSGDAGAATSLTALSFVAKILIWTFLVLVALDNMGVNVTAMVAGLGVGGIAVALAVQNILGDLFASLSIIIDKPFVIGDAISVDQYTGTVEHVGLKTTRLRGAGGEEIIFSNSDLLKTRIRNLKRMTERRMSFTFSVVYGTPTEQLRALPGVLRDIITPLPWVRFERAHLKALTASALDFEVVYTMLTPDLKASLDAQEQINLALLDALAQREVTFAFPSSNTTIVVQPSNA